MFRTDSPLLSLIPNGNVGSGPGVEYWFARDTPFLIKLGLTSVVIDFIEFDVFSEPSFPCTERRWPTIEANHINSRVYARKL